MTNAHCYFHWSDRKHSRTRQCPQWIDIAASKEKTHIKEPGRGYSECTRWTEPVVRGRPRAHTQAGRGKAHWLHGGCHDWAWFATNQRRLPLCLALSALSTPKVVRQSINKVKAASQGHQNPFSLFRFHLRNLIICLSHQTYLAPHSSLHILFISTPVILSCFINPRIFKQIALVFATCIELFLSSPYSA